MLRRSDPCPRHSWTNDLLLMRKTLRLSPCITRQLRRRGGRWVRVKSDSDYSPSMCHRGSIYCLLLERGGRERVRKGSQLGFPISDRSVERHVLIKTPFVRSENGPCVRPGLWPFCSAVCPLLVLSRAGRHRIGAEGSGPRCRCSMPPCAWRVVCPVF